MTLASVSDEERGVVYDGQCGKTGQLECWN